MNKHNNITFVHMAFALFVILGHEYVLLGSTPPILFGVSVHRLGVKGLFFISGLLVSGSYQRQGNRRKFWAKRLWRLYPPLIVCLLV